MSLIETRNLTEDERREPLGMRLWLLPETIAWLIKLADGSDEQAAMHISKYIDSIAAKHHAENHQFH